MALENDRHKLDLYFSGAYADLSARLRINEAAVKMAVLRLRQRYCEVLRLEIAETVAEESEVEAELREVFRSLSN